mgnify:CR=1 FL=1
MTTVGRPNLNKDQWSALLVTSNGRGAIHLAGHLGLLAITSTLILMQVPLWQLLLLPQGILLIFLFAPLHETVHRTAFRSKWCNDGAAFFCGWLLVLPPVWFRYFHLAHHRYTNIADKDPELATEKPQNWAKYIVYMSGIPIWFSRIQDLLRHSTGRDMGEFVPRKAQDHVGLEARWFLALYVIAFAAAGEQLLLIWVYPALIGQPFLRAFLLAEHWKCPNVPDMMANARTTFTTSAMRKLTWNMCYHAEHHAQKAIPFHKLPDFHSHTAPHLKVTQDGYFNLHKSVWRELS